MPRPTERSPIYSDLPLFAVAGTATLPHPGAADPKPVADQYARAVRVPDYDVSSRKSGDQGGSARANEVAAPTKQQQRDAVFAAVSRWTAHGLGLTLRELAHLWLVPMHTVSGRFSELRDLGLICRRLDADGKPVLREGCGVWIVSRFQH